jgi:chemotaxis protein methyltransferase CheR
MSRPPQAAGARWMSKVSLPSEVNDKQLARYAALVYERTGIHIAPQKKTLLSNRVRRRLQHTGIACFDAYYEHLKTLKADHAEWDAFLQEITTHETYLFRDEVQWEWFRNTFIPDRIKAAQTNPLKRTLRIWSAASSTGDEATTVACCLAAGLPKLSDWKIQILGTDIGIGALEQARAGVFGERAMRLVPDDYKRRFFTKAAEGNIWQSKPILTDLLSFRQHNLMHPLKERPFDLVLLKNVLIYFDAASKSTVMNHVKAAIPTGGLLVSGAAEGISDQVHDLERLQSWLFRKPAVQKGNP